MENPESPVNSEFEPARSIFISHVARSGDAVGARRAPADFAALAPYEYCRLASAHARARRSDAAFAALERAYQTRDPEMDDILIDSLLENLRADGRFEAMLTRLGFPISSRASPEL